MKLKDKEKIEARLFPIYISFGINVRNLREDTPIGDLGLDSLDILELRMSIEDAFALRFSPGEGPRVVSTHGEMLELIFEKSLFKIHEA
jgi:acyl carrier protein